MDVAEEDLAQLMQSKTNRKGVFSQEVSEWLAVSVQDLYKQWVHQTQLGHSGSISDEKEG